jgi:phosphoribosylaminoimidazole carboxylase (NCAIR synthetase)
VLTRHGKAVAAVVSMAELRRLHKLHDAEDISDHGHRPVTFTLGKELHMTNAEAAEHVLRVQMDRLTEREVLKKAGLEPVPGGELTEEMEVVREPARQRRRRWWFW